MRDGGLFGRIALKKGLVSEASLERALRFQEEVRAFGLQKPLGELLVRDGTLTREQVALILRLQRLNENRRQSKRFARVAARNGLVADDELAAAQAQQREERFRRSLGEVLVARGQLDLPRVRAIERALARAAAAAPPEPVEVDRRALPTLRFEPGGLDDEDTVTGLLPGLPARAASVGSTGAADGVPPELAPTVLLRGGVTAVEVRVDPADLAVEPREEVAGRDLLFAAVALRDGLVLVPELERALEEQRLLPEAPPLEEVLIRRGVLTPSLVGQVISSLAESRAERLTIPGYEVLDLLGQGATSIVLRARHELMAREVAIKVLREEHAGGDAEAAVAEARTTARVQHEHVVALFEVGRIQRRVYYVMELVDGPTLMDRIREGEPLGERDVLRWGRCVARALEAIEAAGLVHRDVKPHNILLTRDGGAKLADLGLAREVGRLGPDQPGAIYGTPHTISPEQARAAALDIRSDLYSLGATLHHALAGRPPFDGDQPLTILLGHLEQPVPDLRACRPDLRRRTAALVRSLLAKDPAERPASPAEVVAAIDALLG